MLPPVMSCPRHLWVYSAALPAITPCPISKLGKTETSPSGSHHIDENFAKKVCSTLSGLRESFGNWAASSSRLRPHCVMYGLGLYLKSSQNILVLWMYAFSDFSVDLWLFSGVTIKSFWRVFICFLMSPWGTRAWSFLLSYFAEDSVAFWPFHFERH